MSWTFYLGSIAFFTILLAVFLSIAYSVMLGIWDNYRRYYQKADLQWTGSNRRESRKNLPIFRILLVAFFLAWVVVHFVIHP